MKWWSKKEDLYSPERLVRVLENGILLIAEQEATNDEARRYRTEAALLQQSELLAKLLTTLRRDAVKVGIEEMKVMDHALYAKAIFHVTGLLESYITEIATLDVAGHK